MSIFTHPEFDRHVHVAFVCDSAAGLRAIVALHRVTSFGGASGGCRMWPYASEDEALTDVLRLSRMMSYKLALAGVPQGGAKTVVIGDPVRDKSEALLRAIGRVVDGFGGRYVTGGDVGIGHEDLAIIAEETPYVIHAGAESDASLSTAYGVLSGLQAAVAKRLGRDDLGGLAVAVQGLGNVGRLICKLLAERGARLVVTDVRDEVVDRVCRELGAEAVPPTAIYGVDVDVFCPCALGAVLDAETVDRLRCTVVAGAANNQLASAELAGVLAQRGILYAPDFVVNAGGALTSGVRAQGAAVDPARLDRVGETLKAVFARAEHDGVSTHQAAERLARERAPYL